MSTIQVYIIIILINFGDPTLGQGETPEGVQSSRGNSGNSKFVPGYYVPTKGGSQPKWKSNTVLTELTNSLQEDVEELKNSKGNMEQEIAKINSALQLLTNSIANKLDVPEFNSFKDNVTQDQVVTNATTTNLYHLVQNKVDNSIFNWFKEDLEANQKVTNQTLIQLSKSMEGKVDLALFNSFKAKQKKSQNSADQALGDSIAELTSIVDKTFVSTTTVIPSTISTTQTRAAPPVCDKIDLYQDKDQMGIKLELNVCPNQCYKLPPSMSKKASSINTHGGCVLVWFTPDCTGKSIPLNVEPGGPFNCHLNFGDCDRTYAPPIPKLNDEVMAVSACKYSSRG